VTQEWRRAARLAFAVYGKDLKLYQHCRCTTFQWISMQKVNLRIVNFTLGSTLP
jgi:hypothetical protein